MTEKMTEKWRAEKYTRYSLAFNSPRVVILMKNLPSHWEESRALGKVLTRMTVPNKDITKQP